MNQGYQSEYLTYVKRTGCLSNGPIARTTSRYGRPLGTAAIDRRAGFVEFAPAARKFPDNSPLNNESPRKVISTTKNEEWEKVEATVDSEEITSEEPATPATVEPVVSPAETKLGFGTAGFSSTAFYNSTSSCSTSTNRKEVMKMKDHDTMEQDALSTSSDNPNSRGGEVSGESGSSRTVRRRSPAASINGDEQLKIRSKTASPATNGNNSAIVHILRGSPLIGLAPAPHAESSYGTNNSASVGQNEQLATSPLMASAKSDESHESSDKIFSNPRVPRIEPILAVRPKRNIIPKNMESGLSWREENDLKKALYASLQETKRSGEEMSGTSENGTPNSDKPDRRRHLGTKYWLSSVVDESSQDSTRSGVSSEASSDTKGSLLKVRAQRKFAVGSRPGSPGTTPVKAKTTPRKFFTTKKAKTEDFLTFLCLRGSHMLPPHLDFSKIDDSEDCFQTNSCPNTPRSSRPGTPAMAGLGIRDITPRGGRGALGSRSTTPDKELNLDDNDLGVKPLPNDSSSPENSPTKKSTTKQSTSPSKAMLGKRKSTGKYEDETPNEKKPRGREKAQISLRKKDKDRNKKKKKSHSSGTGDGKVKKKKKKRKEEAKMLRKKLVLRACNTAVKASKRKQLKLAEAERANQRELRGNSQGVGEDKGQGGGGQRLESISSILEGLTTKRGVGRPRKVDTREGSAAKARDSSKANKRTSDQEPPLTRTRSPETRSSTRASSRSVSPYKSQPTSTKSSDSTARDSDKHSSSESSGRSSKKDKRSSSRKKRDKAAKRALAKKKLTRSEARLLERETHKEGVPNVQQGEASGSGQGLVVEAQQQQQQQQTQPMYRTRSLPLLPPGAINDQQSAEPLRATSALRRALSSVTKSVKKSASATPAMPTVVFPEKKGRGRPPGSGKKSNNISILKMSFRTPFPSPSDPGQVVEIPTYHPSSEQFQDPISYIQSIRADAEPFGMCRIVPPDGWKPECKFPDDLKFMTQMQYIHRMRDRFGPNALALECIRRHLQSQGIKLEQAPMVGGVELDLPALSETLQNFGGMQSVIDKNKWPKVIESLRIPKLAPERCSKLYDSYCKFLLSYDTLPAEEKQRLEQQVLSERDKGQPSPNDDCVHKGRIRHLSDFFRHARNIESVWFKKEPSVEEVEELYWRLVEKGEHHVAVQAAEVDTKVCGSGFPTKKDSPYSRHGWNLNILQHNSGSVLRCLGPVSGVTVPLLHVGMTFSTKCWSANDHLLPQVVYKHTGADTTWYCLPASEESKFHSVCKTLVPDHADDDPVWLLDDTVMISPETLTQHGVSVGRTTLSPGQFLFVFPEAFTSSVSCGYNLSESLHFATADWIPLGAKASQMLHDSGVPEQFSMDRLLFKLGRYEKTPLETLEFVLPQLELVIEREIRERQELEDAGLHASERMCLYDDDIITSSKKRHKYESPEPEENSCEVSKKICYFSMVLNEVEDTVYSLEHALGHVQKKRNLKVCKLLYRYSIDEMNTVLANVRARIAGEEPESAGPPVKKKAGK